MYIGMNKQNNGVADAIDGKRFSTSLLTAICVFSILLSASTVFAQEEVAEESNAKDAVYINLVDKDYSVLLSALFGESSRKVKDGADAFVRDVDVYRMRIAQAAQQNLTLAESIKNYVASLPESALELEKLDALLAKAQNNQQEVMPFVESDAFLVSVVSHKYDLYPSFLKKVFESVSHNRQKERLSEIKDAVVETRKDLAAYLANLKGFEN